MTLSEKHYWQVSIEQLRTHIADLHVVAVRQGLVMPQAWCESLERDVLSFAVRVSRQITQEHSGANGVLSAAEAAETISLGNESRGVRERVH